MTHSTLSTVYLVYVNDGHYEQAVYVITPERKDAVTIAKGRTELLNPRLTCVYKRRLYELEPEEREKFVNGIIMFEPETYTK